MKNLLVTLSFVVLKCYSQNLVPNPSFETITSCNLPGGGVNIGYMPPWDGATDGNPDPYNTCSTSCTSVPGNCFGYQIPHSGNGYVGFCPYQAGNGYFEYLQVQLDSAMVSGQKYCASFYVSLANFSAIACNNFGIYFSNTHTYIPTIDTLGFTPQINDTSIVSDTVGWKLIYGQYTAHGGERYIIIGNFYSIANTDTTYLQGSHAGGDAYYYLDDVNVHCCTCDSINIGINEISNEKKIQVYPNPNDGNMVLEYFIDEGAIGIITIYDISGRVVKQLVLPSQNKLLTIIANELDAGTYYYVIKVGDKNVKADKLVIIK